MFKKINNLFNKKVLERIDNYEKFVTSIENTNGPIPYETTTGENNSHLFPLICGDIVAPDKTKEDRYLKRIAKSVDDELFTEILLINDRFIRVIHERGVPNKVRHNEHDMGISKGDTKSLIILENGYTKLDKLNKKNLEKKLTELMCTPCSSTILTQLRNDMKKWRKGMQRTIGICVGVVIVLAITGGVLIKVLNKDTDEEVTDMDDIIDDVIDDDDDISSMPSEDMTDEERNSDY